MSKTHIITLEVETDASQANVKHHFEMLNEYGEGKLAKAQDGEPAEFQEFTIKQVTALTIDQTK